MKRKKSQRRNGATVPEQPVHPIGTGRMRAKFIAFCTAVGCLATPAVCLAEPRASGSHIPVLWGICAVGALAIGALPHFLKLKRLNPWLVSVVLVILFLLFVAPVIMIFGSIVATGRTM